MCLSVCLFSIEIQIAGQIWMKFGTEVVLEGGKVLGGKFITQKLLGTPNLVGLGYLIGPQIQIWKDLALVCFWSHGNSLSRGVYSTKVVKYVPNRYPSHSAWPQGPSCQCLAIPIYFWYQISRLNTLFKTSFDSSRATKASTEYMLINGLYTNWPHHFSWWDRYRL